MVASRIFDIDPASSRAGVTQYVVLGDNELKQMAYAAPDVRNRTKYYTDFEVPITWYCCNGTIVQQRDFLTYKVIPDLFIRQQAEDTQILWIPSHESKIKTSFRTDVLEVIDGVVKLKEFNLFHKTKYTIGLGKAWFSRGDKFDEENLKVEHVEPGSGCSGVLLD